MPFLQVLKMDGRRLLAHRVLVEGWSVASACRESGVSRQTAYVWLSRAKESGIAQMQERSRRPCKMPTRTDQVLEAELLAMRERYPGFGPKKLCEKLEGRLHPRTAARILARHGLSVHILKAPEPCTRFERSFVNELWQVDFKGIKRRARDYEILSVLDDSARFCVCLRAVKDLSTDSAWGALWDAFGEYGLPEAILTDNGSAFVGGWAKTLSHFEVRLLKLGIRPLHGRPCHPQTQGKVERFHGTLQRDLGAKLLQPSLLKAQNLLQNWRDFYNWERPHEAIGQKAPGTLYKASPKSRPHKLPEPEYPSGTPTRKVDTSGFFAYKGNLYKAGKGLIGETLGLVPGEQNVHVLFAGYDLGPLDLFNTKV